VRQSVEVYDARLQAKAVAIDLVMQNVIDIMVVDSNCRKLRLRAWNPPVCCKKVIYSYRCSRQLHTLLVTVRTHGVNDVGREQERGRRDCLQSVGGLVCAATESIVDAPELWYFLLRGFVPFRALTYTVSVAEHDTQTRHPLRNCR
jgi:hypothetical protein